MGEGKIERIVVMEGTTSLWLQCGSGGMRSPATICRWGGSGCGVLGSLVDRGSVLCGLCFNTQLGSGHTMGEVLCWPVCLCGRRAVRAISTWSEVVIHATLASCGDAIPVDFSGGIRDTSGLF